MFLEKEVRPEGEPVKLKLSAAIRLGALTVPEQTSWAGCAVGTALKAVGLDPAQMSHPWITAAEVFHVPDYIIHTYSQMHYTGEAGRMKIADELEARGY